MTTLQDDLRGKMFRGQRQLPDQEARNFLRQQKIAFIGSADAEARPYVVPMSFIYEAGDELWFHTGPHEGHMFHNIAANQRICLTVAGIGALTPVKDGFACDSSLLYSSVVVYGTARVLNDRDKKIWFFDRMVEKYGDPSLTFKPGYPMVDRIILFRMAIEILTGKQNSGMAH
jgi:nitroimidazol reductase NimA-like FMN-containing flavoprotein (pyridoxamine 5'-phosphate oxidase superfamily)